MLKHLGLILLTYSALVLQTGLLISIGSVTPMFLPLVLLVVIFCVAGRSALLWAAMIGLLDDCLTPDQPGIGLICATITLYVVQRRLFLRPAESLSSIAVHGFGTVFGYLFVIGILRDLAGGRTLHVVSHFTASAGSALYSLVIGLVLLGCFLVFRRLLNRILPSGIPRRGSRWEMLVE